jgi:hypothetical protein
MPTPKEKAAHALKLKIKNLLENHAEEVIDALLEWSPWHAGVNTMQTYKRRSDDTDGQDQGISVTFGPDNDAWFEIRSFTKDRETGESKFDRGSHRFRTYFGGGSSLRVRAALIILARAIDLDQTENPDR